MAQIAFVGARFNAPLFGWRQHYLHGAKRAGNDAGFAADAFRLIDQNSIITLTNSAVRAATRAGGILAVMAGCHPSLVIHLYGRNTRNKLSRS